MNTVWWVVGASSIVLLGPRILFGGRRRSRQRDDALVEDWNNEPRFYCERVCASERVMDKMGGWDKGATPSNCITVCGTSSADACKEACSKVICSGSSPVPRWNEKCMAKCSEQCLKGRTGP